MRRLIGQAGRRVGRFTGRALRLVVFALVAAGLALAALAWRLNEGPLDMPWLVRLLETASSDGEGRPLVSAGSASLVWEGFRKGVDRPLDMRLTDVVLRDRGGGAVMRVPSVDVSLSLRGLAFGRLLPRAIDIEGARFIAVREADGRMAFDLAGGAEPTEASGPGEARSGTLLAALLAEFGGPADTDLVPSGSPFSQLRRLRVHDATATLIDRGNNVTWRVARATLDLRRDVAGGVRGEAALRLLAGEVPVEVSATISIPAGGGGAILHAEMPTVVPAAFAAIAPVLAPLAVVQAPVAASVQLRVDADLVLRDARAQLRVAGGRLRLANGSLPIAGGLIELAGTQDEVRISVPRLALQAAADRVPAILQAAARLARVPGGVRGTITADIDRVDFADVPALWPDGLGGPGTKTWIAGNITAGIARDFHIELDLEAPADLSDATLTGMVGGVAGEGLVVHWLRPVPPAEGVHGRLRFVSPDEIMIEVAGGRQGGLVAGAGSVRLTELASRHQFADILVPLDGPVTELIAVLRHPRVGLLDKRPIALRNPAGQVSGRLSVRALPLEDNLSIDDVRLGAEGRIAGLRLDGIAAGHDLTAGNLIFEADNDHLLLKGDAALAGIASQIRVDMDFRPGPANQVIQRIAVSGSTDAAQLARLGLDPPVLSLSGVAGLKLEAVTRRNNRGEVSVRADLTRMALQADRLAWRKPAGRRAEAELRVQLDRDRFAGADRLRVQGEGVDLEAQLEASFGQPRRLKLSRAVLGAGTDVQGEVIWPRAAGEAWMVRLAGRSLDASGEFGTHGATTGKPGEDVSGPPWSLEAQFDRVALGEGRSLAGVVLSAENDGLVTRRATLKGRTADGGFELSILPESGVASGRRRTLSGTSQDAGGLLAALDVIDQMRGGQMTLSGSYDDTRPDRPLTGLAEITGFRIANAPAMAKLLQLITIYGAVAAMQGPDMAFERLAAPFRLAGGLLDITDSRAFNASLGMTAKGRIDLNRQVIDIQGTIVPAYFLNSLLGRLPLVGRLLSPEAGGGLFAMSYGMRGPIADPSVWVNPLSAVTPGVLRGLFGVFEGSPGGGSSGSAPAASVPRPPQDVPNTGGRN